MSRTLLITGAAGGMGMACARLTAARGYDIFLVSEEASYISGTDLLVGGGFIGNFKVQHG